MQLKKQFWIGNGTNSYFFTFSTFSTFFKITEQNKMFRVFFDGCSKGNPGPGAGAAVIYAPSGARVYAAGRFLQHCTNNEAEYNGLLLGLQWLNKHHQDVGNVEYARIVGDSKLVIEQMKGAYKVNAVNLQPLFVEAQALTRQMPRVEFEHVVRSANAEADMQCNKACNMRADVID
jgi:ribonuclease HI